MWQWRVAKTWIPASKQDFSIESSPNPKSNTDKNDSVVQSIVDKPILCNAPKFVFPTNFWSEFLVWV